jgi:3-isopropylmalate dehydrogenase
MSEKTWKLAVLPGDGIGPEVVGAALSVLQDCCKAFGFHVETVELPFGGIAIDRVGQPFPQETRDTCLRADAVLLGAVGGAKWDTVPLNQRPEAGLLALRNALGAYANIRPIRLSEALRPLSPLRLGPNTVVNFEIIRELLGDLYFGKHTNEGSGADERASDVATYSVPEVERITRVAFERARRRSRKVASVDKANVLATSTLWRKTVTRMGKDAPDLTIEHLYVDNASMQIILRPDQFDVVLTSNMFGDILSDEGSALVGSIGMVPSLSAGDGPPLVEPIHGTAPQLVGKDVANPSGTILCVSMLLRDRFGLPEPAAIIERAIDDVLAEGIRTPDVAAPGCTTVSGSKFTGHVRERIQKLVEKAKPQSA